MNNMFFRDQRVDRVRVITSSSAEELEQLIEAVMREWVVVDLQYNVTGDPAKCFSALALLRKKRSDRSKARDG